MWLYEVLENRITEVQVCGDFNRLIDVVLRLQAKSICLGDLMELYYSRDGGARAESMSSILNDHLKKCLKTWKPNDQIDTKTSVHKLVAGRPEVFCDAASTIW